jgi:methylmalonyl-CoA mutase C-terminal domain/subunit
VLLPEVTERLQQEGAGDILVFAGGIIPDKDIPGLKEAGIAEVFLPGSSTREIVDYLRRRFDEAPAEAGA